MRRNSKYFHPGNDEQSASKHKVNKKQPRSGSKRNKVLLTCVICEGDAHGKLTKTKLISPEKLVLFRI